MKNVYLFQPQHAIPVGDQVNYWMPYSVGCIWSYAHQFDDIRDNFNLGQLFFRRDSLEKVTAEISEPAVFGFSCYIWNRRYCLGIAEQLKARWPDVPVVFGGPEVNGDFLNYDFIDSLIMGEGEALFLATLRNILQGRPLEPLVKKTRLQDLDIPSPYLDGTFDGLITDNPDVTWATTIETNRGCPYSCTFCDWGSLTYSKIKKFRLERVALELEWIKRRPIAYLFVADANFGIFRERDMEIARLLRSAADQGSIDAVNLQYAKNSTEAVFEIGRILGPYNRGITVSVQSMNPATLTAIKRQNLAVNDIQKLMELSDRYGVTAYTEVILGLPLETLETWKQGLCDLLSLGQHQAIDLAFTELLENSELNTVASQKKYGIKWREAEQFYSLERDQYPETARVVTETSTMSTKDMVEGYLYAWMIIHLHITGYTQLLARYLDRVESISYRQYYDRLFQLIRSEDPLKQHLDQLEESLEIYLCTGQLITKERRGDTLYFISQEFCADHVDHIQRLGIAVFNEFSTHIDDIQTLQELWIWKPDQQLPQTITLPVDINSWSVKDTTYKISMPLQHKKNDAWVNRRRGVRKNNLEVIQRIASPKITSSPSEDDTVLDGSSGTVIYKS